MAYTALYKILPLHTFLAGTLYRCYVLLCMSHEGYKLSVCPAADVTKYDCLVKTLSIKGSNFIKNA
jgi:hypothetical protein